VLGKYRQWGYVDFGMIKSDLPTDVFRERLRTARELRSWSQSDLASRCGMPTSSVGHFEGGTRKPSFDNLRKLANALEVTTDYLLGRVDDPGRAEAGDPLFRDIGKLSGGDRDLARDFLQMLASRSVVRK
jgi:transcriptional regulator with XRE-family HTH domain